MSSNTPQEDGPVPVPDSPTQQYAQQIPISQIQQHVVPNQVLSGQDQIVEIVDESSLNQGGVQYVVQNQYMPNQFIQQPMNMNNNQQQPQVITQNGIEYIIEGVEGNQNNIIMQHQFNNNPSGSFQQVIVGNHGKEMGTLEVLDGNVEYVVEEFPSLPNTPQTTQINVNISQPPKKQQQQQLQQQPLQQQPPKNQNIEDFQQQQQPYLVQEIIQQPVMPNSNNIEMRPMSSPSINPVNQQGGGDSSKVETNILVLRDEKKGSLGDNSATTLLICIFGQLCCTLVCAHLIGLIFGIVVYFFVGKGSTNGKVKSLKTLVLGITGFDCFGCIVCLFLVAFGMICFPITIVLLLAILFIAGLVIIAIVAVVVLVFAIIVIAILAVLMVPLGIIFAPFIFVLLVMSAPFLIFLCMPLIILIAIIAAACNS